MIKYIAKHEFEPYVIKTRKLVLVCFWAPHVEESTNLISTFEKISNIGNIPRDVDFILINVDDESELAKAYKVDFIPTMFFFYDGKIQTKASGYVEEEKILQKINELLYKR